MCLVSFAVGVLPQLPLVVAANRDELHERPARPAHVWSDAPEVFAGRDLGQGGTWLGVAPGPRLAFVTNLRSPKARRVGLSRGHIVRDYLRTQAPLTELALDLARRASSFPSFNAVLAEGDAAYYVTDEGRVRKLEPGIYGLSNDRLDVAWPKVERAREAMRRTVEALGETRGSSPDASLLFEMLTNREVPVDARLPSTGVPPDVERKLAPPFVKDPTYGTRCSTVVFVRADGSARFEERSYDERGEHVGTIDRELDLSPP